MSNSMDDNQRLQLQNMISENNVIDKTELIRRIKHSSILKEEINNLLTIMEEHSDDKDEIRTKSMSKCNFLFQYYTDIYNKVKNKEVDLKMLFEFIDVLAQIENSEIDQHQGSFKIGSILKEMYIDSALKKSEKLDKEYEQNNEKVVFKKATSSISWSSFKQKQLNC